MEGHLQTKSYLGDVAYISPPALQIIFNPLELLWTSLFGHIALVQAAWYIIAFTVASSHGRDKDSDSVSPCPNKIASVRNC